MSKGKLIVISGASGVGKGTVLGIMMKKRKDLSFSVSATTRPPRPDEIDGVHYYFISRETFEEMIANGAFLEYDAHAANYYGTPRAQAEEKQKNGPVLLDIEPAGAKQVRERVPDAERPGTGAGRGTGTGTGFHFGAMHELVWELDSFSCIFRRK